VNLSVEFPGDYRQYSACVPHLVKKLCLMRDTSFIHEDCAPDTKCH
jgi:hypothetical protein